MTHGDTLLLVCVTPYFVCVWGFTPWVTQVTQIVHEYVYARVWGGCANGVTLCHVSLLPGTTGTRPMVSTLVD